MNFDQACQSAKKMARMHGCTVYVYRLTYNTSVYFECSMYARNQAPIAYAQADGTMLFDNVPYTV